MKILQKHAKTERACASERDYREYLRQPHLDTEHARIIASDGHILATQPVTLAAPVESGEAFDASGPIPAAALQAARKAINLRTGDCGTLDCADDSAVTVSSTATDAMRMNMPRPKARGFPSNEMLERIIPEQAPEAWQYRLDANLLRRLLDAIVDDTAKGCACVVLHIPVEKLRGALDTKAALRIDYQSAQADTPNIGVIMPRRK